MSVSSPRLQLADLGEPAVLPLPLPDEEMLAAKWGGPEFKRGIAWRDIEALADLFLACDRSDPEALRHAWHHLLLAAGNFKRSAGTILPPALWGTPLLERPACRQIPVSETDSRPLKRDDPATWRMLTRVEGLGVPTATTVLSALLPGKHVIIDVRATRAAIGLGAGASWDVARLESQWLPERVEAVLRLVQAHCSRDSIGVRLPGSQR